MTFGVLTSRLAMSISATPDRRVRRKDTFMRTIRIFEHISLDGIIQNADEDGDFPYGAWTAPYRTPAGREAGGAAQGASFDLLLGRRTYDLWSEYWPKAPSSPI